ncbi:MAG: DUF488 domain-containing protein [Deltaproteobacteria bacterium]|nr:DUF488 domain-containing protein [Deltaproteobacteria bacterium]
MGPYPCGSLGPCLAISQKVHLSSYANLREEVDQHQKAVEGAWVREEITAWRKLDCAWQDQRIGEIRESLRKEIGQLKEASSAEQKMECLLRLKPIKELLSWMQLELALESDRRKDALKELKQIERRYREAGYDKVADHFLELAQQLEQEISSRRVYKDLRIEDTDDPALFIRMGALHPELLNCFNPNANPTFTQNVVAALGSKNMRLVVVREQGHIVAVAMMKVKQTEEGEAVLFLEKGLYRKGYDFRREMLDHLLKKAKTLPIPTRVATQIMGQVREEDPTLFGTGAYTRSVYEEAVFGLRASNNVRHRGRWVESASKIPLSPTLPLQGGGSLGSPLPRGERVRERVASAVLGIGTSNKTIEQYIAELKAASVTCVVDVRQNPQSQWFPQFNRRALEASLAKENIHYVFMGDTLGNPKIAGERSLENFERQHRQTEAYRRGLDQLVKLIRENEGKVALTCSEGKEQECHRSFILRDLLALPF